MVDLQRALDLSPESEKPVIAEKLAAARQMQQSQAANEPIVEEPPDEEEGDAPYAAASAEATPQSAPESRYALPQNTKLTRTPTGSCLQPSPGWCLHCHGDALRIVPCIGNIACHMLRRPAGLELNGLAGRTA